MRRSAAFSAALIVTLALGIAANTVVFTVINAVVLRPLPYREPNRLVLLDVVHKADGTSNGVTLNRYDMLRDQARSLSSVAAVTNDSLNLSGIGIPQQISAARVSGNFFETLGVRPQFGRVFNDSDARSESQPVLVLSDQTWRVTFNSDRHVVGRTVNLDSQSYTVVGVLPSNVRFPFLSATDIWLPRYFELSLFNTARLRGGVGYLTVIGRLNPSSSIQSAVAEMHVLDRHYTDLDPKAPDAGDSLETRVVNLREYASANLRPRLLLLAAAVALVLLIACSNAANLLLSRALENTQEVAIRTALGATRPIIIGQLLTESCLLSLIAGAIGTGTSFILVQIIRSYGPEQLAISGIETDWRVLVFALLVSILTGIGFGIIPALHMSQTDPQKALRVEGAWSTADKSHAFLQSTFLSGQVALSLMLLIGSALLIRSYGQLSHVSPGFDSSGLLSVNVSLPTAKYSRPDQQVIFFRELLSKVEGLPGVRSAAVSSALPPMKKRITPVLPEGQPEAPLSERPFITIEMVSPMWFGTMRVPLRGRDFNGADVATAPKVLIANDAFVRRFWPNQNPIGKHVIVGRQAPSEVVGVAGNVKNNGITADPQPQLYIPFAQLPWRDMNVLVRTSLEPHALVPALRQQVLSVDSDQPVADVKTGEELLDSSKAEMRFTTLLLGAFALAALGLALVGLYGVLAYSTARRRREIGLRIALGASPSAIMRLIVRSGISLTSIGVGCGLLGAAGLTRIISGFLYKIKALDPLSFAVAALLFFLTALVASYLPARRASRTDPSQTLR